MNTTQLDGVSNLNQLNLAQGMTAGYGDNDGVISNPRLPTTSTTGAPINPYGEYSSSVWPVQRQGLMRNMPGSLPNVPDPGYYTMYFLYNPNQITAMFSTNLSQTPASYLYGQTSNQQGQNAPSLAANVPNLTNGQTVSWSLMFDRTYDLLYQANPGSNRGVLKDVAALYNLMGTFESTGAVPISTPVQVMFGQTSDGEIWGFTGYITSINITYGIFRQNMIPSRCEIDLQMLATYVAPQVGQSNDYLQFSKPQGPPAPLSATPAPNLP